VVCRWPRRAKQMPRAMSLPVQPGREASARPIGMFAPAPSQDSAVFRYSEMLFSGVFFEKLPPEPSNIIERAGRKAVRVQNVRK